MTSFLPISLSPGGSRLYVPEHVAFELHQAPTPPVLVTPGAPTTATPAPTNGSAVPAQPTTPSTPVTPATPSTPDAPVVDGHAKPIPPSHGTTPGGLPSWYGGHLGLEHRGWLSLTGNVDLVAGHTFFDSYRSLDAARHHAEGATQAQTGAVAIMHHDDRYFLTRLYNAEWSWRHGIQLRQSNLEFGKLRPLENLHPELVGIVDGTRWVAR